MVLGGLAEIWLGVDAEQETLEDVAEPLTAEGERRDPPRVDRRDRQQRAMKSAMTDNWSNF